MSYASRLRYRLNKRFEQWRTSSSPSVKRANSDENLLTEQTIRSFLEALDCPRALAVWLCYKHDEHLELVNLPEPCDTGDPEAYQKAYIATELLSKAKFLKLAEELRVNTATTKYWEAERSCAQTNRRLINVNQDPLFEGEMAKIIHMAWYWIAKIVGNGPSVEEFFDGANWGPGVTQTLKGKAATGYDKYQSERCATTALWRLVGPQWKHQYPNWDLGYPRYSDAIDVMFVPKNAKTHRTIGVEPGLNVWFQKSLGRWLRHRLKLFGVDLDLGQQMHRRFARLLSISGEGVTVDFSSASDHIAQECVRLLLSCSKGGLRLLKLLEICRTPLAKLDGKLFALEKFSSMGNGFTFELQTLIFYALGLACTTDLSKTVSVYGDDVILPTSSYPAFSRVCSFLGLKINETKSCTGGYFRESCGGHYYAGTDCKPFYLRESITDETIYKVANSIRLCSSRFTCATVHRRMRRAWSRLYKSVPAPFRFAQPLNLRDPEDPTVFTDGAFVLTDTEIADQIAEGLVSVAPYGHEGFHTLVVGRTPVSKTGDGAGMLLLRLRQIGLDTGVAQRNSVALRSQTTVSLKWLAVAPWNNISGW